MAVGKNKRLTKGGKKGGKKKAGDPFLKKDWFDIKAPNCFKIRNAGKTLITRTQGTRIASEEIKGRVLEINCADLQGNEAVAHQKIKLCIEEVQGKNCLSDFHAMCLTRDKICSLIRKWHTLIDTYADVKTTDGYVVRLFVIAFTKKMANQVATKCYAQMGQIRRIRKKIVDILTEEAGTVPLRELAKKLVAESINNTIEKRTGCIFPLKDVYVRKMKIVKKPKFDITKLMEAHHDTDGADDGAAIGRPETEEAQNLLTANINAAAEVEAE